MVVLTLVCSWDREGMSTQQLGGQPWNGEVMDVGVGMAPSPSEQENCTYRTGKGWVIKCEYAGYVWRSLEADQLLAISNLYGIHVQQSHLATRKMCFWLQIVLYNHSQKFYRFGWKTFKILHKVRGINLQIEHW